MKLSNLVFLLATALFVPGMASAQDEDTSPTRRSERAWTGIRTERAEGGERQRRADAGPGQDGERAEGRRGMQGPGGGEMSGRRGMMPLVRAKEEIARLNRMTNDIAREKADSKERAERDNLDEAAKARREKILALREELLGLEKEEFVGRVLREVERNQRTLKERLERFETSAPEGAPPQMLENLKKMVNQLETITKTEKNFDSLSKVISELEIVQIGGPEASAARERLEQERESLSKRLERINDELQGSGGRAERGPRRPDSPEGAPPPPERPRRPAPPPEEEPTM